MPNNMKRGPGNSRRPGGIKPKVTPVGRALRSAGGALGRAYAGDVGSLAGRLAGAAISKITGNGSYEVGDLMPVQESLNLSSIVSRKGSGVTASQAPSFRNMKGREVRLQHREYISDLVSTGSDFSIKSYTVNAGDPTTFPWLAPIAKSFQKYRFNGLCFQFRSTSSEYASGAALGAVVMATNYNSQDAGYTSKQQMENSANSVSCKPSCSMLHAIECKQSDQAARWYYTRDGINSVSSVQLYDLCDVYVATQGISAPVGTSLGELWVTYDVTLNEPIQVPPSPDWTQSWISPAKYTRASSGFAMGPFLLNSTDGFTPTPPLLPNRAWGGLIKLFSGAPTTYNAVSLGNPLLITDPVLTAYSTTANTLRRYYVTQNGVYNISCQLSTLSAANTYPWIATAGPGVVITALPEYTSFGPTCNAADITTGWSVTVTGALSEPTAYLPYFEITSSGSQTFTNAIFRVDVVTRYPLP